MPTMSDMETNPPPPRGQLSIDGPAGDLDARGAQLRAELDRLDTAKNAARTEALAAVQIAAAAHAGAGRRLDEAVAEARAYDATWQQIADAAGMARPSAWKRWSGRG
jgi:hypothetical protein